MPLLSLIRFPGMFPAIACVLAGYLIPRLAGYGQGDLRTVGFALVACALLHFGTSGWGALIRREDREVEGSETSDLVGATSAFFLSIVLCSAAFLLCMCIGLAGVLSGGGLLMVRLMLAAGIRRMPPLDLILGGAVFPLCLLLGMSPHPDAFSVWSEPRMQAPLFLLFVYGVALEALRSTSRWGATDSDCVPSPDEEEKVEDIPDLPPEEGFPLWFVVDRFLVLTALGLLILTPLSAAWVLPRVPLAMLLLGAQFVWLLALAIGARGVGAHPLAERVGQVGLVLVPLLVCGMAASFAGDGPLALSVGGRSLYLPLPPSRELAGLVLVLVGAVPAYILGRRIEMD